MSGKKLNLEEIIEMAIGIERTGEAFYKRLSELAGPGQPRDLFSWLASEEHKHVKNFETVLKSALSRRGGLVYAANQEELLYLRAFASHAVFASPEQAASRADVLRDTIEGIDLALNLEFRSVTFYQDMARIIEDPKDRASVLELERQEREHAARLYCIREKVSVA